MNWFKGNGMRFQPGTFVNSRSKICFALFTLVFSLLITRAFIIHLFPPKSQNLSRIATKQYIKRLKISHYRGTVYDHRGEPLAISIRRSSAFVNPKIFNPSAPQIKMLSRILKIKRSKIRKAAKKKKYFAWLKRKISPRQSEKIKLLNLKGLYQVSEPARFYPNKAAAANLLGYVGMDDQGLMGIELQYDKELRGAAARVEQSRDAKGNVIFLESSSARPQTPGNNIYLTLDRVIQEIAEEELRKGVREAKAKSGFVIVSDPHTGRLLAVANYPNFNPNDVGKLRIKNTKNFALTNVFEPGSVIKPIVIVDAFKRAKTWETKRYDCEGGKLKIGKHTINDDHKPPKQYLNTKEIIMHSSNVCTFKIAKQIGMKNLYENLVHFGLGQTEPNVNYPGEHHGFIHPWKKWREIRFANIAFGQGLLTNGIQIVQAYGSIANGGQLMQAHLIDRVTDNKGSTLRSTAPKIIRRVMSPKLSKRIRKILEATVEERVPNAHLDQYSAAGKTGTTQKVDPKTKRYSHTLHLSSFAGIAPARDPHLVIYVQLDEPRKPQSYGALWAAPVFSRVANRVLSYLNVAPDKLELAQSKNKKKTL